MYMYIYEAAKADQGQFVQFWSQRYEYAKESLYDNNIGQELTEQRIMELFVWKNGTSLSERKRKSVTQNFVARRHELIQFQNNIDVRGFIKHFGNGGAIWRIFWLHCNHPNEFPIYDQHVHRAMIYIQTGEIKEIPKYDPRKIDVYINRYLPFHSQFSAINGRLVDKALWAFGKFINENNFPGLGGARGLQI